MLDTQKGFLGTAIIDPVKSNLTSVLFWGGIFLVFVGATLGEVIDSYKYIPNGMGESILKTGSAILGAGVFAAIMKSGQFTELFQKHIYDVFYDPARVKEAGHLIDKWQTITTALLKDVLPTTYKKAVDSIAEQFFNPELTYHFEAFSTSYCIKIDEANDVMEVENTTCTTIVFSPNEADPIFKQSITADSDDDFQLVTLLLNDKPIPTDGLYTAKDGDSKEYHLSLPLGEHAAVFAGSNDRVVKLERTTKWKQKFSVEPYIKAESPRVPWRLVGLSQTTMAA